MTGKLACGRRKTINMEKVEPDAIDAATAPFLASSAMQLWNSTSLRADLKSDFDMPCMEKTSSRWGCSSALNKNNLVMFMQ
jgi:hypothetical protein